MAAKSVIPDTTDPVVEPVCCANCTAGVEFLVADEGANPVNYCRLCLPHHLSARAANGEFKV